MNNQSGRGYREAFSRFQGRIFGPFYFFYSITNLILRWIHFAIRRKCDGLTR